MNCKKCGTEFAENASFCPNCGCKAGGSPKGISINAILEKVKTIYLSFEEKITKRTAIIASTALFIAFVVTLSIAISNGTKLARYNEFVEALNSSFGDGLGWGELDDTEDNANNSSTSDNENGDQSSTVDEVKPIELSSKQNVTIDDVCEFYIDYSKITKKVLPPNPDSYYSYYEAGNGKTYIDLCIAYKNLDVQDVEADTVIGAKLKYDNKYDYTGFSCIEEDNRGDFTYSNITSISPLTTEYLHYLFEVPEAVGEGTESIVITLYVSGNEYIYRVR